MSYTFNGKRYATYDQYRQAQRNAERQKDIALVRTVRSNPDLKRSQVRELNQKAQLVIDDLSRRCGVKGLTFEEKQAIAQQAYQEAIQSYKGTVDFKSHLTSKIMDKFLKS